MAPFPKFFDGLTDGPCTEYRLDGSADEKPDGRGLGWGLGVGLLFLAGSSYQPEALDWTGNVKVSKGQAKKPPLFHDVWSMNQWFGGQPCFVVRSEEPRNTEEQRQPVSVQE